MAVRRERRGRRGRLLIVTTVLPHREPVGQRRRWRRIELRIGPGGVDHLAADYGEQRLEVLDLVDREREVVAAQDREIGELAGLQRSFLVLLRRDPRPDRK